MQNISILYDAEKHLFHLSNNKISYIMELKEQTLLHRYWGRNIRGYYGANCPKAVKRTFAASLNPENLLFSLEKGRARRHIEKPRKQGYSAVQ